ncbi:response regulator [Chondrinema litorale]|uniref:response regulator n=1 Tax=Chondrinema litorale TaxID=2994555 RepID=UPI002542A547|nr:response regulator [Chondrinema litorale]UZR97286.1 response regulator [Chondrinema litorale]
MILIENEFLIVEDHYIDFEIIKIKIQQHFPNIDFVKSINGQEALDLIQKRIDQLKGLPGVILLDLHMPFINGFQFLEAFKNIYPDYLAKPKIILLTSSLNPDYKRLANEYKVDGFMIKPICINTLKSILW